ncbi:MAG: alpha/beta hydrolase [Opitutales bacterium]
MARAFTLILLLLAGGLSLNLLAWWLADRLMYPAPPAQYGPDLVNVTLPLASGERLAARLSVPARARGLVLYAHGNGEDLGSLRGRMAAWNQRGYGILAWDYPGYGLSEGRPSEKGAIAAQQAAYAYATDVLGVAAERIILYGRSIGSGPTLWLAGQVPIGAVILEAPFTGVLDVVLPLPWLLDRFPNEDRIADSRAPVLIIHGDADTVIPQKHGRRLLKAAPPGSGYLWVTGAGHNNIVESAGALYWDAIERFLSNVEP